MLLLAVAIAVVGKGLFISCSTVLLQLRARFLVTRVTQPIQSSVIFVMVTSDEGGLGFSAHSSLCLCFKAVVFTAGVSVVYVDI